MRIIVATDGSPGANRAVDAAARLAKEKRCELVILTIGGSITGAELRQLASSYGDLSKTLERTTNKVLEQGAQARAAHRGRHRQTADRLGRSRRNDHRGRPPQADILVVGRRGRGRLSGLLLGSVSQKLASLAPCVVMVVP